MTNPDARAMATSRPGSAVIGYNVQTAVDAKHLVVAHEVTNDGSDRSQLSKMALKLREAMGTPDLQVLADQGYYNGVELKVCQDERVAALCTQADDLKCKGCRSLRQDRLHLHRPR